MASSVKVKEEDVGFGKAMGPTDEPTQWRPTLVPDGCDALFMHLSLKRTQTNRNHKGPAVPHRHSDKLQVLLVQECLKTRLADAVASNLGDAFQQHAGKRSLYSSCEHMSWSCVGLASLSSPHSCSHQSARNKHPNLFVSHGQVYDHVSGRAA